MAKAAGDGYFIVGDRSLLDSLPARCGANQDQVRERDGQSVAPMAGKPRVTRDHRWRARRVIMLSALLVVGRYLLVTP